MAWLTTDDGRKVNTDWFDEDERKKYAQIEKNQKQANERNGKINNFKIEEKKWSKSELKDLQEVNEFMSKHFGHIEDLTGPLYRKGVGAIDGGHRGIYDRDGSFMGKGRGTYFDKNYVNKELIQHEIMHAVTEEIASHYKELGFKNEDEVFKAMRSQVFQRIGKPEPTYDERKWADRAKEFLSRYTETIDDNTTAVLNLSTLSVIKDWYKKIGRK